VNTQLRTFKKSVGLTREGTRNRFFNCSGRSNHCTTK